MNSYSFRPARVSDAPAIHRIALKEAGSAVLSISVLRSQRFADYAEALIESASFADSRFWVCEHLTLGVIGVAETKLTLESLVLNHIYIDDRHQNRRLGVQLLLFALLEHGSRQLVELDVSSDNPHAARWYEHLGFERTGQMYWFPVNTAELSGEDGTDWAILGYPAAKACHNVFGFSQVTLQTTAGSYSIGRIDSILRIPDSSILNDAVALGALKQVAPNSVAYLRTDSPSFASRQNALCFLRLSGSVSIIKERLLDKQT